MEIEPSAKMSLQIQEARRTYESAIQSLHKIHQKFNLKLATENMLKKLDTEQLSRNPLFIGSSFRTAVFILP